MVKGWHLSRASTAISISACCFADGAGTSKRGGQSVALWQAAADMVRYYWKDGGYADGTTACMEHRREGWADRVYSVRQENEARGCSRAIPLLAAPRQLVPPK